MQDESRLRRYGGLAAEDALNTYFVDRSYDEVRVYKCEKCGHTFEENLAKRTKLPYTSWWYEQNVDKFFEETK